MESLVAVEMESFCISYRKKKPLTETFEAQLNCNPSSETEMKKKIEKAVTQSFSALRQRKTQKSMKQPVL